MASKRMTANPLKPNRYRPGKAIAEVSSSEESESEAEDDQDVKAIAAPPKATSFPSKSHQVAKKIGRVSIDEDGANRKAQATDLEAQRIAKAAEDEGFVTEESASDDTEQSGSGSAVESSSEVSSSDEEEPRRLLRPTFIKKNLRKESDSLLDTQREEERQAEEATRRKEEADAMIQEQLDKDAEAKAAGKKAWDDDEVIEIDLVDDTDDLDPEAERAAWRLREFKRVKREREAIEIAEKEREEVERRRNLSKEEREAEDQEFLEAQKEARDGRGKMSYQQKYFHKGAFFQDDDVAETLANRDIMGSRIADDVANKELLPQFMQIRDMSKLGKKGRTKYKDLKSEDTGRWGQNLGRDQRKERIDERFQSDRDRERSGANAAPLGENRRIVGVQARGRDVSAAQNDRDRQWESGRREGREEARKGWIHSNSRSRSREASQHRRTSYSRSRSASRRHGRKRSGSPRGDSHAADKRRRLEQNV